MLRKRPAFREAFADFDPEVVAEFGDDDVARLMADAGIVRNLAKIEATIANGRALRALHADGGSLDAVLWSHAPDRTGWARPATWADVPADHRPSPRRSPRSSSRSGSGSSGRPRRTPRCRPAGSSTTTSSTCPSAPAVL